MNSEVEKADIAIKNKLYVPKWYMLNYLKEIREEKDIAKDDTVYLHYENGKAVGCAIRLAREEKPEVVSFVKKAYRRRGIGTKLIQQIEDYENCNAYMGIWGSEKFWSRTGIEIKDKDKWEKQEPKKVTN